MSNFKMDIHVQNILAECTQRVYLIKADKASGNASTAVVNYHTLLLFHAFYTLSQLGEAS